MRDPDHLGLGDWVPALRNRTKSEKNRIFFACMIPSGPNFRPKRKSELNPDQRMAETSGPNFQEIW